MNVYKSLYALLAYINEPLLEEALLKRMKWRCHEQLQLEGAMDVDAEPVFKRSETEKKKIKFHAWGGKRTADPSNDVIPNPVYRAKFHSWGGKKRSVPVTAPGPAE